MKNEKMVANQKRTQEQKNASNNTSGDESMKLQSSSNATTNKVKRMSISLSGDAAQLLDFLSENQGVTQNEALRKAIATEAYLLQERMQGSKVLLQKSDNDIREVIFR